MKILNIIKVSMLVGAGICTLASCDNIKENDRFIPVERPEGMNRNSLVLEFTGMGCMNCPVAAATMEELKENYPKGSVIVVGLHPENHGYTKPMRGLDLTCSEATVFYNHYNVGDVFPAGVIDGGSVNYDYLTWASSVIDDMSKPAVANIDLDVTYDSSSRKITANYNVNFNFEYQEPCSVLVWIMENKIIGSQQLSTGIKRDYEHNHVLRGSLNGDWGEKIGSTFLAGDNVTNTVEFTVPEKWVAENCQIVAFLFKDSNKVVEQAVVTDVVTSAEVE